MTRPLVFLSLCGLIGLTNGNAKDYSTICVVRELDESNVPARVAGVIRSVDVRRGHPVRKGQQLARLDDRETRLRLDVSLAELDQSLVSARNTGPITSAQSRLEKSQEELRLIQQLGTRAVYLERYRAEKMVAESIGDLDGAENELAQAQSQAKVDRKEVDLLQYELDQSTISSPYVGQIRDVPVNVGEFVEKGATIAVVTRMDRLLVEGFLKSHDLPPHRVTGAKATVTLDLGPDEPIVLEGLVVRHTSPNLELDGKYSIWLEIENSQRADPKGDMQWLIRPAMNGTLTVSVE